MSFSIVTSDFGVARLTIEGKLDDATTAVLRLELSNLLRRRPARVNLYVTRREALGDYGKRVLLSFFDLFREQGGLLVLCDLQGPPVPVLEPLQMERLLRTEGASVRKT